MAPPTGPYDAVLFVSFGGPEGHDDVLPFLERVTAGRNIPRERLEEVGAHYRLFDGVSPINDRNREMIAALEQELATHGPDLPVYWGNRNWHPLLEETLAQMADDGVKRALAFVTSAYASYSGCRQYREDIARAGESLGPRAPHVDKIRVYYNHPTFVAIQADRVREAMDGLGVGSPRLVFTTHSIPLSMARHCDYEAQTREACELVAAAVGVAEWDLVYNSRSGPPSVPWLVPNVNDHVEDLAARGVPGAVVVPIGFVSDHMEVVYDLDVEARETAERCGIAMARAGTVGDDPRFAGMIRALITERTSELAVRETVGLRGPYHDACPLDCCRVPGQPTRAAVADAAPPASGRPR